MNVANLNSFDNPSCSDRQAAVRRTLQEIDEIVSRLKSSVHNAATNADSFDQTERSVREVVFKMGWQAMQMFIQLQGDGDLGETVATSECKTLCRSKQTASTSIRSIFGVHRFEQFTYAPAAKEHREGFQARSFRISPGSTVIWKRTLIGCATMNTYAAATRSHRA